MLAVIIGIILIIVAVALFLGGLSTVHAIAFLIGAIGLLLVLYYVAPTRYYNRRQ